MAGPRGRVSKDEAIRAIALILRDASIRSVLRTRADEGRSAPQDEGEHDGCQFKMTKPLANRIALVTGASRGIGKAVALALSGAGAHVIALARTTGGLEELD